MLLPWRYQCGQNPGLLGQKSQLTANDATTCDPVEVLGKLAGGCHGRILFSFITRGQLGGSEGHIEGDLNNSPGSMRTT